MCIEDGKRLVLAFSYYEPGTKRVFKKFEQQKAQLMNAIEQRIAQEWARDFAQTKRATHKSFQGKTIRECRVNAGTLPAFRVAFVLEQAAVQVLFISTQIQKSDFTHDLDALLS